VMLLLRPRPCENKSGPSCHRFSDYAYVLFFIGCSVVSLDCWFSD
jgi:hypothetical protein